MSERDIAAIADDNERYRAALQFLAEKHRRRSESWRPQRTDLPDTAKGWSDGFVTALAEVSLIAKAALDPEGTRLVDEQSEVAAMGTDREWFDLTGLCGHCGNEPANCACTPNDPCGCGPHEVDPWPRRCSACGGKGHHDAPAWVVQAGG